jgi:oxygen-independent coproporphyrinogen-3 oxidase
MTEEGFLPLTLSSFFRFNACGNLDDNHVKYIEMLSYLYIHIPFCLKKCIYCDFYSVPDGVPLIDAYVEALCREIDMRQDHIHVLEAIYIGGGTPSLLEEKHIAKIMGKLNSKWRTNREIEITSEANPGTLSDRGIKAMLDWGINRISIGAQSLDDDELRLLGRMHDAAGAVRALHDARRWGFTNISVDLMYGIPGQDNKSWKRTLNEIVRLHPEHLSTYELTPEKNTLLYEHLENGIFCMPDEDAVAEMYYSAIDMLEAHGYAHYEISNFALPGYECRHNLNYWNRGEYIGLGAGAHSFCGGIRSANANEVEGYINAIDEDRLPVTEEMVLNAEDTVKEVLFLGLRKREGIRFDEMPAETVEKMKETLENLARQGLIESSDNLIKLTRRGLLLCNEVIVRLMLCIERNRPA